MSRKKTAGQRLRDWRLDVSGERGHKLTLVQVGELIGKHYNHVVALQSGKRKPGRELALKLQALTGIRIDEW